MQKEERQSTDALCDDCAARKKTTKWTERKGPVVFLEKKRSCGDLKESNWSAATRDQGFLRRGNEHNVCAYTQ